MSVFHFHSICNFLVFKYLVLGVGLFLNISSCAQQYLPNSQLTGQALATELRRQYYPHEVLNYSQARDTLYALIDRQANDSIYCIYTGYAHYLDLSQDPSKAIYDDGKTTGMNCEHSWPQSKGTKQGQAKSDMHHLFPTRVDVNQARGNLPYGEVYDPAATHWYRNTTNQRQLPEVSYIAEFSELGQGYFEPREDKKGDVARALFYVYVMYYDQVDHLFFTEQAQTLLHWHELDPVDAQEIRRNQFIAIYQDGKENPFILDPTLAARLLEE